MKLKRTLRIAGLVVLVLFLALAGIFFFWLGPVVKAVAEQVGPKLLGTPLTIESLTISPRKGTVHLKGFAIANQAEFGRTNAVSLAKLDVEIDPSSLFSDTVTVHRVQIDSPHFVYEQNDATDNITEFIRHAMESMGDNPKPAPADEAGTEKEDSQRSAKAVVVEHLEINDLRFYVANTEQPDLNIEFGMERLGLSMTNGLVQLDNLYVSNPQLLNLPKLFTLDRIEIRLVPASILTAQPEIESFRVLRPHLHLEQNPTANTTGAFLELADAIMARLPQPTEKTAATPKATGSKPSGKPVAPPVVLHDLLIDDIRVMLLNTVGTNTVHEARLLAGIEAIEADMDKGSLHIGEITVPNMPGFAATNLFHLAGIDIALEPDSLFQPPLEIRDIAIAPATIHLEQTETSGNVHDLITTLERFAPDTPPMTAAAGPSKTKPNASEAPAEPPLVLHHLQATNFAVYIKIPLTTNMMAGTMSKLKLDKLNPIGKVSLSDLNPLQMLHKDSTNAPAEELDSGPLKLLAFDRLTVEPEKGAIQLQGLAVANLRSFSNPHMATIDRLTVTFDPESLPRETLLIKEIAIATPHISYELQVRTDNIRALQAAITLAVERREKGYATETPEPVPAQEATAEENGQKVVIERFVVEDGRVTPKLSILPEVPLPLPKIELTDIGKESGGATFTEAFSLIGGTLYESILGVVVNTTGIAGDALKGAGNMTFGKLLDITGVRETETDEPDSAEETTEPEQEKKERPRHRRSTPRGRHFP